MVRRRSCRRDLRCPRCGSNWDAEGRTLPQKADLSLLRRRLPLHPGRQPPPLPGENYPAGARLSSRRAPRAGEGERGEPERGAEREVADEAESAGSRGERLRREVGDARQFVGAGAAQGGPDYECQRAPRIPFWEEIRESSRPTTFNLSHARIAVNKSLLPRWACKGMFTEIKRESQSTHPFSRDGRRASMRVSAPQAQFRNPRHAPTCP